MSAPAVAARQGDPIGRIPFAPEGWVFLLPVVAADAALFYFGFAAAGWVAALLTFFVAFFFRDPPRPRPGEDGDVLSPADGRISLVDETEHPEMPGGRCRRVAIFLSVFDVHMNRASVAGHVEKVEHTPGKFLNAMKAEAADVNERNDIVLATAWGPIVVRQIAGLIARRIVCRVRAGEELARGDRVGLIRFGSRTEVYLPLEAEILVQRGHYVRGASTIIARLSEPPTPEPPTPQG